MRISVSPPDIGTIAIRFISATQRQSGSSVEPASSRRSNFDSVLPPSATTRFNPRANDVSDCGWGGGVLVPAKTGVLPVWACGLWRTLLAVEVRNAYWRQFHAMRVQAFIHATVFPRGSTAELLHIRAAISSQGDLCLRIRRRWGPSRSRSPRYRGGSSNGWRRSRRWGDLRKDFPVCGFQFGYLAHHLVLTGGELLHSLPQRS